MLNDQVLPLNSPPVPKLNWRDIFSAVVFCGAGSVIVLLAMRFVINVLGITVDPDSESMGSPAAFISGASIYLLLILGVYVFGVRKVGWRAMGFSGTEIGNYLLVFPLFALGMIGLLVANLSMGQLNGGEFVNPQVEAVAGNGNLGPQQLVLMFILIAVLAPIAEEIFFRGMLYPLLRERFGMVAGVVSNALIFALIHFIPILIPGLFIVGLCITYLRERSGSIWPSVLYHMLQNSLGLIAIVVAIQSGAV